MSGLFEHRGFKYNIIYCIVDSKIISQMIHNNFKYCFYSIRSGVIWISNLTKSGYFWVWERTGNGCVDDFLCLDMWVQEATSRYRFSHPEVKSVVFAFIFVFLSQQLNFYFSSFSFRLLYFFYSHTYMNVLRSRYIHLLSWVLLLFRWISQH